jgi:hypothetical protein
MTAPIRVFSIAALFVGLLVVGCSKPADKIVGTWTIDVEATLKADPKTKDMKPDDLKKQVEMAKKFMGEMTFEFTKDGKMVAAFGKEKKEGTYTVKATEGNTVTLETKTKEGDKVKEEELKVVVDGDKLSITDKNQTLVLARK